MRPGLAPHSAALAARLLAGRRGELLELALGEELALARLRDECDEVGCGQNGRLAAERAG